MKKSILTILGLLVILGVILFFTQKKTLVVEEPVSSTYTSEKYGISFEVPEGYTLSESERGSAHRGHYSIVMIKNEDLPAPENGEGPTSINIDIYQNNIDQQTLPAWFHGTNNSNSKLTATQSYASTTVAGKEAIAYRWSGLYEGETIAFRHNGNIVALTVTYMDEQDKNIAAFREILLSLTLRDQAPLTQNQAIALIQIMMPEFGDYPSDNLPPKRIFSELLPSGDWRIGFVSLGSGRPGVLAAKCFLVTTAREITSAGEFKAGANDNVENLNLATCKAK